MIELKQAEIPMPDEKQLRILDRLVRLFGVKLVGRSPLLMSIDLDYYVDISTGHISLVGDRFSGNYQCHYELVVNYLIGKINGCGVGDLCWMRLTTVNNLDIWQLRWFHECVPDHMGVKEGDIYTCLKQATDLIEAEFAENEPEHPKPENWLACQCQRWAAG